MSKERFIERQTDVWLRMIEDRNLTSHAYDEALAHRIYGHIAREGVPIYPESTVA